MRYNAVTRRVYFANHTAETKGQYQFICLRQRKVTNMQLESATNKSNKSPEVFWLGFFCFFFHFHTLRRPARTRIFFSRQQRCAGENTDVKLILSSATYYVLLSTLFVHLFILFLGEDYCRWQRLSSTFKSRERRPTYPGFSASKHGAAAARPGRTASPHP